MNDRNDLNTNGDAIQDSIVVRSLEHGDIEKIMQVDWSNQVENSYAWRDGKLILVKEKPVYVGPDYTREEKVEQIKKVGRLHCLKQKYWDLLNIMVKNSKLMG